MTAPAFYTEWYGHMCGYSEEETLRLLGRYKRRYGSLPEITEERRSFLEVLRGLRLMSNEERQRLLGILEEPAL